MKVLVCILAIALATSASAQVELTGKNTVVTVLQTQQNNAPVVVQATHHKEYAVRVISIFTIDSISTITMSYSLISPDSARIGILENNALIPLRLKESSQGPLEKTGTISFTRKKESHDILVLKIEMYDPSAKSWLISFTHPFIMDTRPTEETRLQARSLVRPNRL